ncbi:ATP-dependent nuclease [Brevibacillus agri]|uniref:ATP-dependent nuclease n=1 Tax=Brevibacillus agri TaxID=51101 RepID=UPI001C8D2598|nr:AAA family ATPase [Brevibacillus agri]MBY0050952.1 AAA family ATPase [Brevibacillus agri]UUZ84572.1 AAA family ATPase [Paenibacillus sp. P26]UUZ97051.1 AAA family ATPase [Paenibacillus sp. P25]
MRIAKIMIERYRGIKECEIFLSGRTVLVGDNNIGKSTILEAIDLVLGPERLSRSPVIDEHDFYAGEYLDKEGNPVEINIEVIIVDLSDEQQRYFRNHLEWWDNENNLLIDGPPPESTDKESVVAAIRLGFKGNYDADEDDFAGRTYFLSPKKDDGTYEPFRTKDKRVCGFLFLRTLRTGSRALSLERGSLLDIILRLNELRLPMWEDVLKQLRDISVAENPELGISGILESVQNSVQSFVPSDWADNPHLRVSDLTRANLRRILTVFMGTGSIRDDGTEYAAPFQHQGTGTINTLVLTLLSMIAELKQNVIFAMEEPEIAIPPYTQKRIIQSVSSKSAQAIFTSHSPYVLEEFDPSEILVINRVGGKLTGVPAKYPPSVKPKKYRDEFRRRFCEALLARRVLITEGRTEYDSFPAVARRLQELHGEEYKTFEELGVAIVNAEAESQVAPIGEYFRKLGKTTFAVFDKQSDENRRAIESAVDYPFEAQEKGFEDVILEGSKGEALRRYALMLVNDGDWPSHMSAQKPTETMPLDDLKKALREFFTKSKANGSAADFLGQCSKDEMPEFLVSIVKSIQVIIERDLKGKTIVDVDREDVDETSEHIETE